MAKLLKGAAVAEVINSNVQKAAETLRSQGVIPTLAILRVGENSGDIYYERNAIKRCESLGIDTRSLVFDSLVSQEEFLAAIDNLNRDDKVHGVLILRPLPRHISDNAVRDLLSPEKDVDGITDGSMAGVFTGSGRGFTPCTAESCIKILEHYDIECVGKRAVVVGRSLVIGKPAAMLLMAKNATVTICHTKTADLAAETRRADIIIAAAGSAGAIGKEHISPGQVIIDVGINTNADGKLCGDVDFEAAEPTVSAITPIPGGTGSVTTSVLASHVVTAAARKTKINM